MSNVDKYTIEVPEFRAAVKKIKGSHYSGGNAMYFCDNGMVEKSEGELGAYPYRVTGIGEDGVRFASMEHLISYVNNAVTTIHFVGGYFWSSSGHHVRAFYVYLDGVLLGSIEPSNDDRISLLWAARDLLGYDFEKSGEILPFIRENNLNIIIDSFPLPSHQIKSILSFEK